MEGESDSFLKVLQNRSRNFVKKLDRIKKKQAEVKSSGKEMKEEEKKLIESAPLVEELLQENEKVIEAYKKNLESLPKEEKKTPVKVEEDRSKEVVLLWALVEFLSNPQVKDRFIKENPADQQDLEAFLLLHSLVKGQAGKKLLEISEELENSVKLYLSKSEKIAPGTMKSYKKLAEFEGKFRNWANSQQRPATPPKVELTVHSTQVYNTEKPVEESKPEEKKEEVQEATVETVAETRVVKESPPETKNVKDSHQVADDDWAEPAPEKVAQKVSASKWAEDESEEEKTEKKPEAEDDGFVTVTGRKKNNANKPQEYERRGRGRGGRRGGGRGENRGRGRGRGQGQGREGENDS